MSGCIEDAEMEKETTEGGPQGETKWAEYDAEKAKRSVFSSADWGWEARYMENEQERRFNSITKKAKKLIKKMGEDLNRQFSKGDILMIKKHIKRCSKSSLIREKQVQTTMRYQLKAVRMAIIKKKIYKQMLERRWRKGSPPTLLVGM